MKKMFIGCMLLSLIIPTIGFAEIETERLIENINYDITIYPYFNFYYSYGENVTFHSDNTVSVWGREGGGNWFYRGIFKRKFIAQYEGVVDEEFGGWVYFQLIGKSSFDGTIRGFGFWSLGEYNPMDPMPIPVPCYFIGFPY